MISIYGGASPNAIRALIAMEELGIAYRREPLNIIKVPAVLIAHRQHVLKTHFVLPMQV